MKTLLWIDDDEKLIDATTPVFLRYGFRVLKATNTSRALLLLRDERIDGILLDVRLRGGEDGLELLQEIRRLYPSVKVAVFTGYPEYDDHVHAEEMGASVYLAKIKKSLPLDPTQQSHFFQALHALFPGKDSEPAPRKVLKDKRQGATASLWASGLFFLLLFAVIFAGIGILSRNISPWILPIVLIAGILLIVIVGAFVLRVQGESGLSQKNFLLVIRDTLKMVPLLNTKPHEKSEDTAPHDQSTLE